MQSCPKNGLTGPLTGDSKRSSTLPKGNMPLPPVVLALPEEPTSEGPPSPARGSAGMAPPPSPAGATYLQQQTPPTKQETISPNELPVEKKRKARVGKAMVRSNMQNTMLLMCNPSIKREIESPKEKEVIVPVKENIALKISAKDATKLEVPSSPTVETEIEPVVEPAQPEPIKNVEETPEEPSKEIETVLEPVLSTVGENVKVKNMKRKLSLSVERKEDTSNNIAKKPKTEEKSNGSYKNLIKKDTNSIKINNGKRKLIQESNVPDELQSRATALKRRKAQNKQPAPSKNTKKSKQSKSNTALSTDSNTKTSKVEEIANEPVETKENIKRGSAIQQSKTNQKMAASILDNLIAKNNVDRTIECVVSKSVRTSSVTKKTEKVKEIKEVATPAVVKKSTKKTCKESSTKRKSKCKNVSEVVPAKPEKSLGSLRWSNGWNWEGECFEAKVFLNVSFSTKYRVYRRRLVRNISIFYLRYFK